MFKTEWVHVYTYSESRNWKVERDRYKYSYSGSYFSIIDFHLVYTVEH